jgi:hypothetical protein
MPCNIKSQLFLHIPKQLGTVASANGGGLLRTDMPRRCIHLTGRRIEQQCWRSPRTCIPIFVPASSDMVDHDHHAVPRYEAPDVPERAPPLPQMECRMLRLDSWRLRDMARSSFA